VTTEPASHGEREQVIGTLQAAFVQGRLTRAEFDARVGQALTSRTRAELAAMTADIPVGLTGVQPDRQPTLGEPALGEPALGEPALGEPALGEPALGVRSATCVTASAAVLAAVLWAAA